jgi:hypothetical protein
MRTDSDLLLRINQSLSLIVGLLVIGAIGFACCEYGPSVSASVHDFYHPPNEAQRQAEIHKVMMQHVTSPKFEMNEEVRQMFEAREAEFEAARNLAETYRMPPPRRP